MNGDKRGMGGWLSCLTGLLLLFWPFLSLSTFQEIKETEIKYPGLVAAGNWEDFKFKTKAVTTTKIFISIAAGAALAFSRKKRIITYVVAALWIIGPISKIPYILILQSDGRPIDFGEFSLSTIIQVFWTLVFVIYLYRSQRVQNTYVE